MKNILIVEDEANISDFVKGELEYEGYNVCIKEDGREGLEEALKNEYDLIILDVMLPSMNGFEICRRLKREKQSPIIMLSAKDSVMDKVNGLQIGADDYIAKPFSMAILKAKIMNMLRTRHRIFEHYSNTTEIEPEKLTNNTMDEELLRKAIAVIERNMDNVEFSTEQFAREMNMSRSNLHLKLKAITGKSAIDFIHKIRFNRACQLLQEGKYNVSEISFMVGYNTPSYFAARFKKYIGCLPTEYGKK